MPTMPAAIQRPGCRRGTMTSPSDFPVGVREVFTTMRKSSLAPGVVDRDLVEDEVVQSPATQDLFHGAVVDKLLQRGLECLDKLVFAVWNDESGHLHVDELAD